MSKINQLSLSYSVNNEGLILSCKHNDQSFPVNSWGKNEIILQNGTPARIGYLNILLEEEEAFEINDGLDLQIPHSSLSKLESWHVKSLGLPAISPLRLEIETHRTLANDNFSINYGFSFPDGLPASGTTRNGAVLTYNNKKYILTDPLYSVINLLDEYIAKPIKDMDERFLWWGKVRELLPDDTNIGSFLKTIKVVKPESFTLDFKEKNDEIIITPRFVLDSSTPDHEKSSERENDPENLIPQIVHTDFVQNFLRHSSIKDRYALIDKWFVVLPTKLKKALQVVKKINSSSPEEKMSFLHNPRTAIRESLEDEFEEELIESLFVETQLFLNERIKYLGVWLPKAGLYIKTECGQWFPKDGIPKSVNIPLESGLHTIETNDLPKIIDAFEKGLKNGDEHIEFAGKTYPVTSKDFALLKEAANIIKVPVYPDEKIKHEKDLKKNQINKDKIVPIIYDHINEIGINVDSEGQRINIFEGPSQLAQGICLHTHQKEGLDWLKQHWRYASSGALLADDMGLGKTIQALAFMSWVKLQMENGYITSRPFLIVAPTGLLKNWEAEENKFLKSPGLGKLIKAHGREFRQTLNQERNNIISIFKDAGWVLTTYETLRDKIRSFIGVKWAVTIFDEAQKIKNPKAMVTDMAKSVKSEFTLTLTGTPVENSLADLWCIIDAVQPGRLKTLKEFVKIYIPNGQSSPQELKVLKNKLLIPESYPVMLRRSKDEHWKEKPEKEVKLHLVEMPPEQIVAYNNVVQAAKSSEGKKGAILAAINNLRSISLHPQKDISLDNHAAFINTSARMKALFEVLDEVHQRNEKALIFVEFLDIQSILSEIIERRYKCNKIMIISGEVSGSKRQAKVDKFQRSNESFDVMILSPKAGGIGLNLTAATHVIHLSRWWNPAVEDQCSDRAYRIGQTKKVTIHYPLAIHPDLGQEHSFDIKLHELLEKKRNLSQSLLAPPAGNENDINWLFDESIKNSHLSGVDQSNRNNDFENSREIDLYKIDLMEPIEFERWVLSRFKAKGYKVQTTPISGDGGADGIAISPDEASMPSYVIQCKHTQRNNNLGHLAVEEILKAKQNYKNLPENIIPIVTTNAKGFTHKANILAKNRGVRLFSRKQLDIL